MGRYHYGEIISSLEDGTKYESCIISLARYCIVNDCIFYNCTFLKHFDYYFNIGKNVEFHGCCFPSGTKGSILDLCKSSSLVCEGDIIGYKNCFFRRGNGPTSQRIVKLLIPANAKRCNATTTKCRAEFAKVLGIFNLNGKKSIVKSVYSGHDWTFTYEVGKIVKPTGPFDSDRGRECTSGIHFFRTFEEVVNY